MNRGIQFVIMFAALFAVLACAQRRNTSGRIGGGRLSRSGNNYNGVWNTNAAGNVTPGAANQIAAFTSNMVNADGTTVIPCQVTQIRLAANVQTDSPVSSSGNSSANVSGVNGQLHLDIVDTCVGQIDPSTKKPYTDIPVDITSDSDGYNVSGTVQGSSADLVFQDSFGTIELSGSIQGGVFSGNVIYNNDFYYDDGLARTPGYYGSIGTFSMNACSVFVCGN